MRTVIFIGLFLLVALTTAAPTESCEEDSKPYYNLDEAPELFEEFIQKYNKTYKDEDDKQVHYEAFLKSLEFINSANADPNQSATFDINQFADYTDEQRKRMTGLATNDD